MLMEPLTLENEFVRLEPLQEHHREPLRAAAADPELWTFVRTSAAADRFDGYFDEQLGRQALGERISHSVVLKATEAVVGATAFFTIDAPNRCLEVGGTWYIRAVHGGVVNPSCKLLLFERGFECGAERIELNTDARNLRSRAAIERLGARLEGIMRRRHIMPDGFVRDTAKYSLIREEWQAARLGLIERLVHHHP
jgi:RimJ/RimL family protein N-acetyltransferase